MYFLGLRLTKPAFQEICFVSWWWTLNRFLLHKENAIYYYQKEFLSPIHAHWEIPQQTSCGRHLSLCKHLATNISQQTSGKQLSVNVSYMVFSGNNCRKVTYYISGSIMHINILNCCIQTIARNYGKITVPDFILLTVARYTCQSNYM